MIMRKKFTYKMVLNAATASLLFCLLFTSSTLAQPSQKVGYYYKGSKIYFPVSYDRIVAGIKPGNDINKIRKSVAGLIGINPDSVMNGPGGKQILIKLGRNKIKDIEPYLLKLKQHFALSFVRPVLKNQSDNYFSYNEEFIVKLKPSTSSAMLQNLLQQKGCTYVKQYPFQKDIYVLAAGANTDYDGLTMANLFYETGLFEYAEPNKTGYDIFHNTPNDPLYNLQWAHKNNGSAEQYNGTPGADMKIAEAWAISMGNTSIKIAVLDEGVDLTHPDLQANLLQGYDAISMTANPGDGAPYNPLFAHGTNCAGIIAAVANNGIGVAGVAPNCKIIPVKISNDNFGNDINIAAAFDYATNNGADVISNSWGGFAKSSVMDDAIHRAATLGRNGKGCIILFATGNDNWNTISYPSSNPEVIAVGGSNMCDERKSLTSCDGESWWGANYGTGLDVVAPSVKIPTTDIQGTGGYNITSGTQGDYFNFFNGTSSACPNAAGIVALMLSVNNSLTAAEITAILELTCDKLSGYSFGTTASQPNGTWNNEVGHGRVNAWAAINYLTSCQMPVINAVTVTQPVCKTGSIVVEAQGAGYLQYSIDGGLTWSASNTFTNLQYGSYNILIRANYTCVKAYEENPVSIIEPVTPVCPALRVDKLSGTISVCTPSSIPSTVEKYIVTAENLSNDIYVEVTDGFEVSTSETDGYYFYIVIPKSQVNTKTTVYVRLAAPFKLGNTYGEILAYTINSSYEDSKQISGVVTSPKKWYQDLDNDGYGNGSVIINACYAPEGYVNNNLDCNDNDQLNIVYVNKNAQGLNNGSSWANAYQTLQDALVSAGSCFKQIWVAKGTYYPDEGGAAEENNRRSAFVMKWNTVIYGGFAGTETSFNQRNTALNLTTLSGDIDQNDGPGFLNNDNNSYHVIYNYDNYLGAASLIDGFTITGGNANGGSEDNDDYSSGGGMLNFLSSPTISNCIFRDNKAFYGGGISNILSASNVVNCIFINNSSQLGSAVLNSSGTFSGENPSITNCTFYKNVTDPNGGGAIWNAQNSTKITNCILWNNGSEIFNYTENGVITNTVVTNSIVQGGYAGTGNLNIDPLFVDPVNGNLRIQCGSPALNAGTNTGAPYTDIVGNLRARTAEDPVDIGAYEGDAGITSAAIKTKNITVQLTSAGNVIITPDQVDNGSVYACGSFTLSLDKTTFNCTNIGQNVVTLTATDINGNSASATAIVTVEDKTMPIIITKNISVQINATGNAIIADRDVDNGSSDPCGLVSYKLNRTSFNCSNVGPNTVILTVTDANGNQASGSAIVNVLAYNHIYYKDGDGDGFGNPMVTITVCNSTAPSGYVNNNKDCNDSNPAINPDAVEVCGNRIDDNCNGLIDEVACFPCLNATNLTTTNITANSAQLNWTAVANPDQWQIQYKTTNKGSKWVDVFVTGNKRSVTVNQLLASQNYNWQIRAKCGKSWTAYASAVAFKTTGIGSTVEAKKYEIVESLTFEVITAPNPSDSYFTLTVKSSNTTDRILVRVVDELGRVVEQKENVMAGTTVRFGDKYIPGLYFVMVQQGKNSKSVKLVRR